MNFVFQLMRFIVMFLSAARVLFLKSYDGQFTISKQNTFSVGFKKDLFHDVTVFSFFFFSFKQT